MTAGERTIHLLRGAAVLLVAMGLGRFAFTALLPPMQAAAGFRDADAGMMASLNLAGYLAGVLLAGKAPAAWRANLFRGALIFAVATIAGMGLPLGLFGWDVVRAVAGFTSGLLFVLATAYVLDSGAAMGPSGAALHFAGVGTGIATGGIVAAIVPDWRIAWALLGLLALALAAFGRGLTHSPNKERRIAPPTAPIVWTPIFVLLSVAYAMEGFGYIVSGTFIVTIIRRLPETAHLGPFAWVLAGLGAIPSPLVWSRLAHRFGAWEALTLAYVVQAIGIVLPLSGSPAAALLAAFSFGFTFIGITGVSIALAARMQSGAAAAATAVVTIGYGIGQVIGPWAAGWIASATAGFSWPLIGAASAVALSAALSGLGAVVQRRGA